MMRRNRKASAFTLLEMLVATALVAVLAGSLYASLHVAFKARRSSVAIMEPVRKAELAMGLLADDIRSTMVPTGDMAGPFQGEDGQDDRGHDSDTLVFYCTTRSPEPAEGIGDIKKIELYCETSDDGKTQVLVRHITTNLLSPRTVEPLREVLCRGVFGFNLRYYDGSVWQDTWDSTTQGDVLPLAVEVTLQLDDPRQPDSNLGGYTTSQVFLVPCGALPSDTTLVVRPPS